jgi:hypothetical protein
MLLRCSSHSLVSSLPLLASLSASRLSENTQKHSKTLKNTQKHFKTLIKRPKTQRPSAERGGKVEPAMLTFLQDVLDDMAAVPNISKICLLYSYNNKRGAEAKKSFSQQYYRFAVACSL